MSAATLDAFVLARLCDGIADDGYAVVHNFLPAPVVAALALEARRRDAAGEFCAARVDRGARRSQRSDIRGDRMLWLDERSPASAEVPLWQAIEALRAALNQTLYLGLFSFEGHYALYPPGTSYGRHRDQFSDDDARRLSCVWYLNDGWLPEHGGALRLYVADGDVHELLPLGGTLACFLADRFEHEVLSASRERLAVTGWFRRRE